MTDSRNLGSSSRLESAKERIYGRGPDSGRVTDDAQDTEDLVGGSSRDAVETSRAATDAEESERSRLPVKPGWYNDPTGTHSHQAYWDGSKWSGATRPDPRDQGGPKRKRSGLSRSFRFVHFAWLALLGIGPVIALLSQAVRDDSGSITESGDVRTGDLQVGDCFNEPSFNLAINVPGVPCNTPHDYKVFALEDIGTSLGDEFPGQDQVRAQGALLCLEHFEAYIGTPYGESSLGLYLISPSQFSWDSDRNVTCAFYSEDGQLDTSMRGSGR
jgi:hypothetical protein